MDLGVRVYMDSCVPLDLFGGVKQVNVKDMWSIQGVKQVFQDLNILSNSHTSKIILEALFQKNKCAFYFRHIQLY